MIDAFLSGTASPTRISRQPRGRGGRAATARRGSPRRELPADGRARVGSLLVGALHVVHQRIASTLLEDLGALHEDRLRLDEILAPVPPEPRVDERVHPDRVAGTGLDAHAAVDALQGIDLVADGVLLDLRVRMLPRLDVDAFRRTRRRTEKARGTPHRPV